MFWKSVWKGMTVLGHWETYALIAAALIVAFVVTLVESKWSERKGKPLGIPGMILGNAVKMSALIVVLLTLAPIIFHHGEGAAWSGPWVLLRTHPLIVYNLLGLLLVSAAVLDFIPWVNRQPTLFFFLVGCETLAFIASLLNHTLPQLQGVHIALFPGFWFTLGILLMGVVIAKIATPFVMAPLLILDQRFAGVGTALAAAVLGAFGFLPVFIYGAWLGEQVTQALGI